MRGGQHGGIALATVGVFTGFCAAIEQAAIVVVVDLGEAGEAKAQEDCDSDDLFFHCMLCFVCFLIAGVALRFTACLMSCAPTGLFVPIDTTTPSTLIAGLPRNLLRRECVSFGVRDGGCSSAMRIVGVVVVFHGSVDYLTIIFCVLTLSPSINRIT